VRLLRHPFGGFLGGLHKPSRQQTNAMDPMVLQASYRVIPARDWTRHLVSSAFRNHFEYVYVASVLVPDPLTVVGALELNRNRDAIGHVMYRRHVEGSSVHVEIRMLASHVPRLGVGLRLLDEVIATERDANVFIAATLSGTEPFWESVGFVPCAYRSRADRSLRRRLLPSECREDRSRLPMYAWQR
jgi:hypothetical protein